MTGLSRLSIKAKLVLLIIIASSLTVLVSGLIFSARDRASTKKDMQRRLLETAGIIAKNSTAALTSSDPKTADELLGGLMADEHILLAAIYDNKGKIFAQRTRSGKEAPPFIDPAANSGGMFTDKYTEAMAPIVLDQNRIGTIRIRRDLNNLRKRTRDIAITMTLVAIAAILLALLLSTTLQGLITGPLKELAAAMERVRDKRDFSQNLPVETQDETGKLVEIFNDLLSRLKEHEELSQLHRNNLEELVIARTIDLERARQEAETASRIKSEFLANMSHEIRTPLNAIIGMAGLAGKKKLSPDLSHYIKIISSAARTLLATINDILDFSKIEAGRMEMEAIKFPLSDIINNVTSMFAERAAEKGVELVVNTSDAVPKALCGDPLRLQQVLTNLVSNSIKFTPEGEIEIKVVIAETGENHCRLLFSVRDTGIGIKPEKRESLFAAFTQADGSTSRKFGGTGLGLSICRHLVEMMDGRIWVEGEKGQGSTFLFTAVFSLAEEDEKELPATIPDFKGKKVLLVEDNPASRSVFKKMLQSFGFTVTACESGEDALNAAARAEGFDLMVLDWMMPGMDGITLAGKLRADDKYADTPLLMITAFGRDEQRGKAAEAGIEHFLIKPLKRSQLYDAVVDIFGEHKPGLFRVDKDASNDVSLAGRRVLVVEDNHINRQVAKEILHSFDVICDTADNGAEALKAVKRQKYDAVLMDIQMPELDGHEATRCIRRMSGLEGLPIIALTAHASSYDHDNCLKSGMNDYITKPIDQEVMQAALKRWIKGPALALSRAPYHKAYTPSPDAGTGLDDIPGIDVNDGLRRVGGKKSVYLRLLKSFADEYHDIDERVDNLLSEDNIQKIHLLCHSLKGAAGNVSAKATFAVASEICNAASNHDQEAIRDLLPQLGEAIREVHSGISGIDE